MKRSGLGALWPLNRLFGVRASGDSTVAVA